MRLIDADALVGKIKDEWFAGYPRDIFLRYVEELPTVDTEALVVLAFNRGYNYAKAEREE